MANGFSLGILQFQADITKNATPQYKVDPYGFLASLYAAHSRGVIKNATGSGHKKVVKVKRKKRLLESDTRTTAACDDVIQQATVEDTINLTGYREVAINVEDETIRQFDEYASAKVNLGSPGTTLMYEFWDDVQTAANAILQAVDTDLVATAVAAIGENVRTGNANSAAINVALNTTNNPLANGPTQIFSDFKQNSFSGRPIVVGAGLFYNFMLQQPAKGVDQSGVDTRILTNQFDFWYDQNIGEETTDDDSIIVYEKDAVQILEFLQFVGPFAGPKPGNSTFGTLMLPFIVGDQLIPIEFDYQLRYNDCEIEMSVNGYDSTTVGRGWQIILSKTFDLYTIPADAYKVGDRLEGNRGSLLYNITNT